MHTHLCTHVSTWGRTKWSVASAAAVAVEELERWVYCLQQVASPCATAQADRGVPVVTSLRGGATSSGGRKGKKSKAGERKGKKSKSKRRREEGGQAAA